MGVFSETFNYSGTGLQDAINRIGNYGKKDNISVACSGGASDVYVLQEKIGGEWYDSISSLNGIIAPVTMHGPNDAVRLKITTNTSGSINLSITA